jgi:hypothetical protein
VRLLCEHSRVEIPTLVQRLEEAMDRSMGIEILELLLSGSIQSLKGLDDCEYCSLFLHHFFRRGASGEGVQFKANLRDKIIGIGAPAHAFLPALAEKFGTQAVIPFYAGVANAVGAVTSAIVIKEELFIKPFQAGYRIHSSSGIAFFDDLGEASVEGRRRLRETAYQKAKRAGAEEVEVVIDEKESWATARGGDSVFIEKIVTARAMGNPKMYLDQPLAKG